MSAARLGIVEDIDHDPEHKRQREIARYIIGLAINGLRGSRPVWEDAPDKKKLADELEKVALREGIVFYDEWHHAPMCRANNWHRAALPTGPCTCGAERGKIR
jgi:hypothetical protein